HAWRGGSKTWLALGIGCAVAGGGRFLKWAAPKPRRVLYVDGEMPLVTIQERLAGIVAGCDYVIPVESFQLIAADHTETGVPNLATPVGQRAIEEHLEGVDLLILDNLSTLYSSGRDNEVESWTPIQGWLLRLRRRGVSVLLVHHSNKNGQQRGT